MPVPEYVRRLREVVDTDWIMLVGAAALIRDDVGRILLQKRSDFHTWGLPGGTLDPAEDPAAAIVREVREETGLTVAIKRIAGVYSFAVEYPHGDKVWGTSTTFDCRVTGGDLMADEDETLALRFFAFDALPEKIVPQHMPRLEQAAHGNGAYFEPPLDHPDRREYLRAMRQRTGPCMLMVNAAKAVVQRDDGRVLLCRTDNAWRLPGGASHLFENPAQTVARTVMEHTGLTVFPTRLTGVYGGREQIIREPNGDVTAYTTHVFLCAVAGDGLPTANCGFFAPDALPVTVRGDHRERIEHALTRKEAHFEGNLVDQQAD